jgi:hypothetical protein
MSTTISGRAVGNVSGPTLRRLSVAGLAPFNPERINGSADYPVVADIVARRIATLILIDRTIGEPRMNAQQKIRMRQLVREPVAQITDDLPLQLENAYQAALQARRELAKTVLLAALPPNFDLRASGYGVAVRQGRDPEAQAHIYIAPLVGLAIVSMFRTYGSMDSQRHVTLENVGIEPVVLSSDEAEGLLPIGATLLPSLFALPNRLNG